MPKKLIIYLHSNKLNQVSFVELDSNGNILQTVLEADPNTLSGLAKDAEVTVCVPAEEVVLAEVQLPKMSRARIYQALPFAIEDELVEEIEQLHFAIGEYLPQGHLPIAIVSHMRMKKWLDLLLSWSIKANYLYPVTFTLPLKADSWSILVGEMALVRTGAFTGFACDLANLDEMLRFALSNEEKMPQTIYIESLNDKKISPYLHIVPDVKETLIQPAVFLNASALSTYTSCAINLLQARYTAKKSRKDRANKLKLIGIILTSCCASLFLIGPAVSYFILSQRTKALDQEIGTIYKKYFPEAKAIIAPKLRLEEKLHTLSAKEKENRLFILLGRVSESMFDAKNIKIKRMDFQNNQLILALQAPSSDEFSYFIGALEHQGLKVKQQNTDLSGTALAASLLIE